MLRTFLLISGLFLTLGLSACDEGGEGVPPGEAPPAAQPTTPPATPPATE